jgi:hypothetical protein
MLIQLPGGTAIDPEGATISAEDNGDIRLHTPLAISRLIERWRADSHPNLAGLQRDYSDEIQELENAIWDVIVARLPDYAEGVQLDVLGRIVGALRNGRGDAAYRARIRAQIAINSSFGRAVDIISILRLIDSAPFHYRQGGTASFSIDYATPPSNTGIAEEIPAIIKAARAAGVRATVSMPTDITRGARYGSLYHPTINVSIGWSSIYAPGVGGLYGHATLV